MNQGILMTVLMAGILATAYVPARAATILARSVIGAGGAPSAGTLRSNGTLGQPAIGLSMNATTIVHHGFWYGGFLSTVDVVEDPAGPSGVPIRFAVGAPAPNPTSGAVAIALALPAASSVRLTVVDVGGRLVAVVADRLLDAGRHYLSWDGVVDGGFHATSGVYFARLEVDGRLRAKRSIVVVR